MVAIFRSGFRPQRVARRAQHGNSLHDQRSWVEIFIDAMTKAHQFERVIFVFCFCNILVDFLDIAYFIQHVEYRLVGSSMGWPP